MLLGWSAAPPPPPCMCSLMMDDHVTCECSLHSVRMAERSKALRSGRSPLLWAWVRIPLLTRVFFPGLSLPSPCLFCLDVTSWLREEASTTTYSRVAQWKRAGPITQRSVDRNHALLRVLLDFFSRINYKYCDSMSSCPGPLV